MEVDQIIKLMEAVSKNGLTEMSYEENGAILKLKKSNGKIQMQPLQVPNMPVMNAVPVVNTEVSAAGFEGNEADAQPSGNHMSSPLVGTFYAAPSPDAEPFVKVGDTVKKGQVLGIVEAMKLMNEIESEFDGIVKAILVENGELIEYGQDMFIIG
ncbi:Biotin carboxyl carrier protein of acetyl-CoA carboxylase [uncultured Roseburia sp.]|uniref:Biotin carboxyl carrier protein of acetyl-CoA carboxylase n=1 Tax=Brotonthovivens ammoniilytica TaxID=2981725 RepID=A0ABT2TH90_9FIRM|nr:acetyl-CoA carboxylase biotin carboxyl carrier protein [Brotonthovivens ammoniilytica]MCU6761487.1 acetyl-CoA carboxylase biotin carboxyl carrier protein [Brotonthovivens ammoniilytica]SCI29893.1 Biotin carboxyl carrier protein of acetyl-CoA carboxylase [uncultured Roseburia sp.]